VGRAHQVDQLLRAVEIAHVEALRGVQAHVARLVGNERFEHLLKVALGIPQQEIGVEGNVLDAVLVNLVANLGDDVLGRAVGHLAPAGVDRALGAVGAVVGAAARRRDDGVLGFALVKREVGPKIVGLGHFAGHHHIGRGIVGAVLRAEGGIDAADDDHRLFAKTAAQARGQVAHALPPVGHDGRDIDLVGRVIGGVTVVVQPLLEMLPALAVVGLPEVDAGIVLGHAPGGAGLGGFALFGVGLVGRDAVVVHVAFLVHFHKVVQLAALVAGVAEQAGNAQQAIGLRPARPVLGVIDRRIDEQGGLVGGVAVQAGERKVGDDFAR